MSRRSLLFAPGDRPEMLRKAAATDADVVIFDLEDAVAPDRKADAREAVAAVLSDPAFGTEAEVCVRVNPAGIAADDDLGGIAAPLEAGAIDSVLLPKATDADDVRTLDRLVREHGASVPVLVLVETAPAVIHAEDIAAADPASALIFGAEDLAADLGATRTDEGTEVLYAREHVVVATSAAGIDAIDTVYPDFEDTDGLAQEAAFAVQLGYDGKVAIHPAQVGPINDAFTPDPEDIEWANRVLVARDEAAAEGRGVFRVDDEMIDAPLVTQAEQILARARAAGIDVDAG